MHILNFFIFSIWFDVSKCKEYVANNTRFASKVVVPPNDIPNLVNELQIEYPAIKLRNWCIHFIIITNKKWEKWTEITEIINYKRLAEQYYTQLWNELTSCLVESVIGSSFYTHYLFSDLWILSFKIEILRNSAGI